MKEKTLIEIPQKAGKGEISLTDQRVILRKEPFVKYDDATREIPLEKVAGVEVKEMELSASFVINWMGVEVGLLLVFFGLTSASIPLYRVYLTLLGSSNPDWMVHAGRLIISLIMCWFGFMLVPWFDGIILRIKSSDGKVIRYIKNVRFKKELNEFKSRLIQEVQKKTAKPKSGKKK